NFAPFIQALNSFAGVCGQENLKSQEPNNFLSEAPFGPTSSWASFWMPVLLHMDNKVFTRALAYLQRSLVAPEILLNGNIDLTVIFERVLFPVLEELLKPQVFRRDPGGWERPD
ncbi:hypothetical protein PPACK8108_LOCUS24850, partial [Phakopsora pachyrhizi]